MIKIKQAGFLFMMAISLIGCGQNNNVNNNKMDSYNSQNGDIGLEEATFGAGCFWCVEAIFQELKGVTAVEAGYAGGKVLNPTYRQISTGTTEHAEVARVIYNPEIIDFNQLLTVFWHTHDPTTLNRQGADVGTQYRSVIFYHNEKQREQATLSMSETDKSGLWDQPIITEIEELANYSKAENYHQDYFNNNSAQPYCSYVIQPKVNKLRKEFKHLLKEGSLTD